MASLSHFACRALMRIRPRFHLIGKVIRDFSFVSFFLSPYILASVCLPRVLRSHRKAASLNGPLTMTCMQKPLRPRVTKRNCKKNYSLARVVRGRPTLSLSAEVCTLAFNFRRSIFQHVRLIYMSRNKTTSFRNTIIQTDRRSCIMTSARHHRLRPDGVVGSIRFRPQPKN